MSSRAVNLKRERPLSQERDLGSRPTKRLNGDDAPEEGELSDDAGPSVPPPPKHPLPPSPIKLGMAPRPAVGGVAPSTKKVPFPFKKKDVPAPPLAAFVDTPEASDPPRKEPSLPGPSHSLPAPHPSLPAPPTFAALPRKKEPSPTRHQRPISPRRYDEYGRDIRDRDDRDRERRRDHPPVDDWRTRPEDDPPYDLHRERDRDRDRRGGRDPYGSSAREWDRGWERERERDRERARDRPRPGGVDRYVPRSPSPPSYRRRSRTRSRSRSPSRTPPRNRLPPRATRPTSPLPVLRDEMDLGAPTPRTFHAFNIPPPRPPPADLPPRPPPAPLPNHEPKSLSRIDSGPIPAVEEEDLGEIKETDMQVDEPKKPLLAPSSKLEDEVERKIREMEASEKPPVPKWPEKWPLPTPAQRPVGVKRSVEEEKAAYGGRVFTGVSRLAVYRKQDKLGEGTFGEVFKATHTQTGNVVALKRILMHNEFQGLPITAVREIKLLKKLNHPNVVSLVDVVMEPPSGRDDKGSIFMVFPYMDHDLAGLLENENVRLQPSQIKLYMKQLLEGTSYLHRNQILHRDIKAANLLINNRGVLKIADFGLARPVSKEWGEKRGYTNCVVTRWYRPPELLMGAKLYNGAIDMWGCGCILGEMFKRRPILMGESDLGQLEAIFQLCGGPSEGNWPGWKSLPGCEGYQVRVDYQRKFNQYFSMLPNDTVDLLAALLTLDPGKRLSADEALDHPYFWTDPLPADPETMPNWTASKEYDRRKKQEQMQQQQQQQQQQQHHHHHHRGPPRVQYQPQQDGYQFHQRGPRNPNHRGYNPPPGPPRFAGDGLPPPGMTVPGPHNRRFHGSGPPQFQPSGPPSSHPSSLPPIRLGNAGPPQPPQGLPGPMFGGEKGYDGPLVRGGKYPEQAYSGSSGQQRRRDFGRGGGPGDGSLPYG